MKVLELVLKWGSGGVERYIEDLVSASFSIDGLMCSVVSVTTEVSSKVVEGQGPLVTGGLKGVLTKGNVIRSFIAKGGFDVVHIHGNNGFAFFFAHQAARAGAKAIVHSHNSSFGPGSVAAKKVISDAMRKLYMEDCSARLACSQVAGDFLFAGAPFQIVKNGINVERFKFNPTSRERKRAELEIAPDAFVCGFAASINDAKNPLMALSVFRAIKESDDDAVILVCGDGDLFESFKREAADLLAEGSCVLAGRVFDIEVYYSAMDVLIAPSKYEGLPINLVEAQASGLPVVMSDAITEEVVIEGDVCRRVSLDSPVSEWASSLKTVMSDAADRESLGARSVRAVVDSGYSQPLCYQSVFEQYRKVCFCDC